MSNPKPVEGALTAEELRSCLWFERDCINLSVSLDRLNNLLRKREAALSAAPAPDENALIDARERGYDDACSTSLPFSQDAEADFRKWRDLNPDADLRSAWIAGRANEAASQGVKLTKANVAGYEKGFKTAQEYFPEAALNKLVRDWEARVGEKPIERRGAYEAALDDCINELRSIWTPARDGVLRCHACGQDVTGEGYRPHRYVICHKPGCADKHVINSELLDKAICAEDAAKEQADGQSSAGTTGGGE